VHRIIQPFYAYLLQNIIRLEEYHADIPSRSTLTLRSRQGLQLLLVIALIMVVPRAFCSESTEEYGYSHSMKKETVYSVKNRIVEFSVDAETKSGDYIKATNEGGLIFIKGISLKLVPWNAVYDLTTKTWVVFLANVTSDNFQILYLYLHNGTGFFTLWCYDYDASSFEGYIFYGSDLVKNNTLLTASVQMPNLSIVPVAKHASEISALGPSLFIADQQGLYLNGTRNLSLYPILHRSFPGTSELWVVIDDHQGGLYYCILYFFENDTEHVFRGHTLRLNDLYQASFENIAAQWVPGLFPYLLNVNSEDGNVTVKINGFPFKTDKLGRIEIRVPRGDIPIEAQAEVATGVGVRRVFSEWKWFTKSNPTLLRITQNTDLYLTYKTQFYLSLDSPYGSPVGQGWYDAGVAARFSVEPLIEFPNGTRLVFSGWKGDGEAWNPQGETTVDRPKVLRAVWRRQYEILVSTKGLPTGTAVGLMVNENQTSVTVPFTHRQWVDAGSGLTVKVDPTNMTSSEIRYVFRRWQTEAGATVLFPVTVSSPIQLFARYEIQEPFEGKITLQPVPDMLLVRDTITIRGVALPPRSFTNVTILWSKNSIEWAPIATVMVDSKGNYEYVWKAEQLQKIYLKAKWVYDPDYEPLESPVAVVTRVVVPGSGGWESPQFLHTLLGFLEGLHAPSQLVAMLLYPLIVINRLATLLTVAAGTPQWLQEAVTWILTGGLVGPIYLGPFLVIVALVWKRMTKKSVSASKILPVVAVAAIGIGLILVGHVLLAPTITQLGLALAAVTFSFVTASLAAVAIAKIS